MPKVIVNGRTVAESDDTVVVEGNHYFPRGSIDRDAFAASDHTTRCSWKGEASYYDIVVDGERRVNAAWYYAKPKKAAAEIADHVAFYRHKVDAIET